MKIEERTVWGLLRKPKNPKGRWRFIIGTRHIYPTEWGALKQCNEWNVTSSGYVYKPVALRITTEWEE